MNIISYPNPIVNITLEWLESAPLRIGVLLERENGRLSRRTFTGDDAAAVLDRIGRAIDRAEVA